MRGRRPEKHSFPPNADYRDMNKGDPEGGGRLSYIHFFSGAALPLLVSEFLALQFWDFSASEILPFRKLGFNEPPGHQGFSCLTLELSRRSRYA